MTQLPEGLPELPQPTWRSRWYDIPDEMRQGLMSQSFQHLGKQPNFQLSGGASISGDPLLSYGGQGQQGVGGFVPTRAWYSDDQMRAYGIACYKAGLRRAENPSE